jgi:hypothetical protein
MQDKRAHNARLGRKLPFLLLLGVAIMANAQADKYDGKYDIISDYMAVVSAKKDSVSKLYVYQVGDSRYHRIIARQFKAKRSEITNFETSGYSEFKDYQTLENEYNSNVMMNKAGYGFLVNGYGTNLRYYTYVKFDWKGMACKGYFQKGLKRRDYACRKKQK